MSLFKSCLLMLMISMSFLSRAEEKLVFLQEGAHPVKSNTSYILKQDEGEDWSLSEVRSAKWKRRFVEEDIEDDYNANNKDQVFWKKIVAVNKSRSSTWLLEFPDPHIGHLKVYIEVNGKLVEYEEMGFDVAFDKRSLAHKNFTFEIDVPVGDTVVVYAKMWSKRIFDFRCQLRTLPNFVQYFFAEYYLLGLYYGFIFLLVVYNLFLGLYSREKFYLYYCFYTISCALFTYAEDGMGFQWIWPELPRANTLMEFCAPFLLLGSFVLYSSNFIGLKEHFPKLYKNILLLSGVYIVLHVLFQPYRQYTYIIYILPFALTFYSALKSYRGGVSSARFFVIGNSMILISFIVYIGRINGLINSTAFTVYLFNFGFVFEATVFSIALADKVRIAKDQREAAHKEIIRQLEINESLQQKVNKELEEKVQERTKELVEANLKLENLKRELYEMNSKMDINIWELKKEVKKEIEARILNDKVSYEEFMGIYTDNRCYQYLKELKWKEGFTCPKCGNKKYGRGNNNYTFKCTQCQHQESVTSHTLFHGVKFQISKAFYLAYYFFNHGNDKSYEELAEKVGLTKNTVWKFGRKVMSAKSSMGKRPSNSWEKLVLSEVDTVTSTNAG